MTPADYMVEIKRFAEHCEALEARADISQAMSRAREGRFIPLGALGEPASSAEYFADEHDYLRSKTRDAYFSVQDLELRKQLIAAERAVDAEIEKSYAADMSEANQTLLLAQAAADKQPWRTAAVVALGAVALGNWFYGLVGAIAGAVGGFFLSQAIVHEAKVTTKAALSTAVAEIEQLRKDSKQRALHPPIFSINEELTGQRDEHLDRESAYANVLQQERTG